MAKPYLKAAEASSKVAWYVSHGWSFGKIIDRLKTLYSGVDPDKIASLTGYYKSTHSKAKRIMGYAGDYIVDLDKLPTQSKNPKFVRAVVNYEFKNPVTKRSVTRSDTFDVPGGLELSNLLGFLKVLIVNELMSKYSFGSGGVGKASSRVLNLTIAEIEAV